jgi:serpin B
MAVSVGQLAAADAAFGTDLYVKLAGPGNLVLSPASIASALRMALIGARGETATELARALHLPDAAAAREANRELVTIPSGDDMTLNAVNTAWIDDHLRVLDSFLDQPVSVRRADFRDQPEQARQAINESVEEQTAGKIPNLLGRGLISALTRLVLVNAIYLKARWQHEFPEASTRKEPFHPEGSGAIPVDMMHLTERLAYHRGPHHQAVLLPYKSGPLAMAIVLPDGPLSQFQVGDLDGVAGLLREVLAGTQEYQVDLRLPKFRTESSFRLDDTLRSLGVERAFTGAADFSGITADEQLGVSAIVHKAFIEVDERGTEAAAATAVVMMRAALVRPPAKRKVFTADRPFLFAVVETTSGLPLFLGQVTRP